MKKFLLPFFFVGTVLMIWVMAKTGAPLKTPATPLGILDLEFAYNSTKTTAVINAWYEPSHPHKILVAIYNTCWDFLFLFFYAGFLFLACKKIALQVKGPVSKLGNLLARGALLAGVFDILENIGMLLSLHGHIHQFISIFTFIFSVIKWALAIFAVLYVLTGMLRWVFQKIRY